LPAELCAFLLLAAAGLFQAAFALPIQFTRGWRWEQVWAAQSVTANLVFPLLWAALVPGAFWDQAVRIPTSHWITAYGWGLLWGAGGIAYSLALTRLGMAFANSFIIGVTIVTGALLPLALNSTGSPPRPASFIAGLILCVMTTALIGVFRRLGNQMPLIAMPFRLNSYGSVIATAMIAGCLCASYGLAFAFNYQTVRAFSDGGVSALSGSLAILLPVYLGGASVAIPVAIACAARSGSLALFVSGSAGRNWLLAIVMGVCAAGTAICYNLGSTASGHPAPNVSFAIFMTFLVLGGVVLGLITGEMRGSRRAAKIGMILSAGGLAAAASLLNAR
jgi:L-rhamnose-H+ transport protein